VRLHNTVGAFFVACALLALPSPSIELRACDDNDGTDPDSDASTTYANKTTLRSAATAATSTSTTPTASTETTGRSKLCCGQPIIMAGAEKGLVLHASSHWLPANTPTANACCTPTANACCAPTHACCAPSASNWHDILPIRLQCWLFKLGEGMASWQEGILLPDNSKGMPTSSSSCHNLFAL